MKRNDQITTIKRIWKRVKRYRPAILLSLFSAAVSVAASLYLPVLTGQAVDQIAGPGQVSFPALFLILLRMGTAALIMAAFQWIMNICNNRIAFNVVKDIREEAFRKLQVLPLSYIDSHPHGDMVSRIIADADQFSDGLLMGFTQFFTSLLTIAGTLVIMVWINPMIALVVILITPLSLFAAGFIAKRTFHMFQKQSEERGRQTALINEVIEGQKVVQAFSREKEILSEFDGINERLEKDSLDATFYSSLTNPVTRFVNALVYAGVGVAGAFSAIRGALSVGSLVSFLSYANQYTKPFNEISGVVTELQNAIACAGRLLELIDSPAEKPDPEKPLIPSFHETGSVSFEKVCFSYVEDKPLIEGFSLEASEGMRIAIVGPTGSGKTTLINLLMRFYDPVNGRICLNGIDTRDMARQDLRASFGMVLQETWLKKGTIRENITMGKPDATDEEVVRAAKASHAHSFILRLKDGYDTVIGSDGGSLSLGQKQLLCISRVMLALPPMLILDEATSSIDTRTERKIQDAFTEMMKGRTSFIVAHRLSTIQSADRILVMNEGHIVEQGTHEQLLLKNGFYAKLYNSQWA